MKISDQEFSIITLQEYIRNSKTLLSGEINNGFIIIRTYTPVTVEVEHRSYEIDPEKIVFIGPYRNIKIHCQSPDENYIILFTAGFFEQSVGDALLLNSQLFFDNEKFIQITDTLGDGEVFKEMIINRISRYKNKATSLYTKVAHNCIEALLLDGLLWLRSENTQITENKISTLGIVNTFIAMIHRNYKEQINVSYYADLLHITPRKLSESCISILGKTAKETITGIIVKEAVRYIRNTDMSISQISYEMGFTDESNFRRFVKKHSGINPIAHRKKS